MSINSNINLYYEELVQSIAERAYDNMKDGGYSGDDECVWSAIDDGLMYYCDEAYVLAMALCRGVITWNNDVNWDEINDMFCQDVDEEIENIKKKDK